MITHTIDAANKKLGRVASEVAILLMGKDTPAFAKNIVPNVKVVVSNASMLDISEDKKVNMEYKHYSGYPGGLRYEKLDDALTKRGVEEVVRRTVYGMLPTNKLRSKMIKNLLVTK